MTWAASSRPSPPGPANEPLAPSPHAARFSAARAFGAGALYSFLASALVVVGVAPGRYALAQWQENLGRDSTQMFLSGIARDAFDLGPTIGLILAFPLLFTRAFVARRPWHSALFIATPLAALAALVTSCCFSEFSIQRGTFPTWFDLIGGFKDTSFVTSALHVFLYGRHARPILIGLLLIAAISFPWSRAIASLRAHAPAPALAGALTASSLLTIAGGIPHFPGVVLFRRLGDSEVAGSPFHTFLHPMLAESNVRYGVMGAIERAHFNPALEAPGARMLGLPAPANLDGVDCTLHPFRRPLPLADTRAPALVRALTSLSAVLFDTPAPPRRFVQILLESFRADDLHALNPKASRVFAPATNALIENALARKSPDLTIPHFFQAGSRSSQGLSAAMCGLGTMGFNISSARDLGAIPLRCLPDVLVDAGVETHFLYGAEISFDGVDDFLRLHGIRHIHSETALPTGLPHGGWGISDLAMVDELMALLKATPQAPFAWWIWPTLSHHTPFISPIDTPQVVYDRAAEATQGRTISEEERLRLITFSYTDAALEKAIVAIDETPEAAETLVLASADHSTTDIFTWDSSAVRQVRPKSQIPFLLHVPEALVRHHAHANELRDALTAAQLALSAGPISQNDLPTIVLALLSHATPLKALPESKRWHTMGGQRTSPDWALLSRPGAAVAGLNSLGELFVFDPAGTPLGPEIAVGSIATPDDIKKDESEVLPSAALFGHFLRGWGKTCPAPESIRPGAAP